MNRRIKQRQRNNRSIRAMQNNKQNLEVGQRVYVDFLSSNSVDTDGTRISGFGVLDRVEPDGFVCGRLDIGQPFGCHSQYVQLETKVIGIDLGEELKPVQPNIKAVIIDNKDTPCGACDIGVYNELACLNKTARAFGAMSPEERKNNIPRCKNFDRECIGAKDYDHLITEVDVHLEAFTKPKGGLNG